MNQLQAESLKTLTPHRTKDLRSSLDPSSLRYNTKPPIISHRDLHLALQVLHRMQKALITQIQLLALSLHHIDISSTTSLYGLDIYIYIQNRPKHGQTHGMTSPSRYIFPKTQKGGRDPLISASSCAPPSTGCQSSKIGHHDQEIPKTWSRDNSWK
jgi:hypothetical protein